MEGHILCKAPTETSVECHPTPPHPPPHLGRPPRRQRGAAWSQSPAGWSKPGLYSLPPNTSQCPAPSSSVRATKTHHKSRHGPGGAGASGSAPSVPPAQGYLVGTSTLLTEVEGDAVSQLLGAQQVDVVRDKEAPGTRHRGTPPGDKGWGPKIRRPLWLCKLGRRMRGLALSDSMSHLSGDDISLPSRHLPHPPPCPAAPKAFHQLLSVQRDYRITECSGLEGTSVGHLVQPSC